MTQCRYARRIFRIWVMKEKRKAMNQILYNLTILRKTMRTGKFFCENGWDERFRSKNKRKMFWFRPLIASPFMPTFATQTSVEEGRRRVSTSAAGHGGRYGTLLLKSNAPVQNHVVEESEEESEKERWEKICIFYDS